MSTQEFISQIYFKIDETSASAKMMYAVREIVVDTSMYLPDMFSIQLDDPDLSWMDSSLLEIGKTVEISVKAEGDSSAKTLTTGEIVAIEPEFDQGIGTTITIRGYDKSHRLHRGKKSQVFVQQTDSDIVKKIAETNGMEVNMDSTSVVYDHVFQDNQTDIEFIHERARRNGYQSYIESGKLYFKEASSTVSSGVTLEWGENLKNFQARFSGANQVEKSEAHGWDITQKKAITSTKSSPEGTPTVDSQNHGGKIATDTFGSGTTILDSQVIDTQAQADALAQSVLNDGCQKFFEAEGRCSGNPDVRAGKQIEIKGIGKRFSGKYTVTRAIHRYDFSGYTTEFEISGYRANTLTQLLAARGAQPGYGVMVGLVTDSSDPDGLARVKVKYPAIDENLVSDWARLATPMAGAGRGFEFIPEVDDEVLVAFEHNDINKPYIIGSLWNGKDKPAEDNSNIISNGKVQKRIIKSRSGHIITLDDTDGKENICIVDKAGQQVIIDSSSGKEKIEIIDKGEDKITMDGVNKSISIESAQDLTIKASGKLQLEGKTGVNVTSNANLQMEGSSGVDIKSNASMNIKGNMTSIQGQATAELKSSGMLTVQGTMVKIN